MGHRPVVGGTSTEGRRSTLGKKEDTAKRLEVYRRLLNAPDPEKLDKKAFAEGMGINGRILGA